MLLMLNTCSPSGSQELWCLVDRWSLCDQPPGRALGTEPLRSFSRRCGFTYLVTHVVGGIEWSLCDEGKTPRSFCLDSFRLCPLCLFPLLTLFCVFSL